MSQTIAYILKMYPRFSETFIVNEILELERQGVNVRIYSLRMPDDGRFHPSLARVKAEVIYVPRYPQMEMEVVRQAHQRVRRVAPGAWSAVRDYSVSRGHEYAIKRFLQAGYVAAHLLDHPVDAVHAHFASSATRVASLVNRMIGIPYSFTAHAKDIYHESVSLDSLRSKMSDARFVVTVSHFNRTYLNRVAAGSATDDGPDVRCLYNGIDLEYFAPDATVEKNEQLILGVGRLVEKKGFDVLIDACRILTDRGVEYRCEIIGKGAFQARLAAQIEDNELSDQVALVGPLTQNEVRDAYRRAGLFVLPCIVGRDGNRDGLPTVLLEAMASGLPAVSTNLTGIPEIVDHGENGLIAPAGDALALADAMQALLENRNRRNQMSVAARRKVETAFDVRQNVGTLARWLAEPSSRAVPVETQASVNGALPLLPLPTLQDVVASL